MIMIINETILLLQFQKKSSFEKKMTSSASWIKNNMMGVQSKSVSLKFMKDFKKLLKIHFSK